MIETFIDPDPTGGPAAGRMMVHCLTTLVAAPQTHGGEISPHWNWALDGGGCCSGFMEF